MPWDWGSGLFSDLHPPIICKDNSYWATQCLDEVTKFILYMLVLFAKCILLFVKYILLPFSGQSQLYVLNKFNWNLIVSGPLNYSLLYFREIVTVSFLPLAYEILQMLLSFSCSCVEIRMYKERYNSNCQIWTNHIQYPKAQSSTNILSLQTAWTISALTILQLLLCISGVEVPPPLCIYYHFWRVGFIILMFVHWTSVLMLIKRMIQFSARNPILRIFMGGSNFAQVSTK